MCFFPPVVLKSGKRSKIICCWQRVGSFQGRLAIAWEWNSNFWEWLRHLTECVDITNFLAIWVSQEAWERTNKRCTFLQEGRWSAMMEYSSSLFVGLRACVGKAHLSMHKTTMALLAPRKASEKSSEERSQKMEFFSCHRCCARMTTLLSWKSTCGSSIQLSHAWGDDHWAGPSSKLQVAPSCTQKEDHPNDRRCIFCGLTMLKLEPKDWYLLLFLQPLPVIQEPVTSKQKRGYHL